MIYTGDKPATLFHGNQHPVNLYSGAKKITGYSTPTLTGQGQVGWEAPYKASIKDVTVSGAGEQERLSGKNLIDFSKCYPGQGVTVINKKDVVEITANRVDLTPIAFSPSVFLPLGTYRFSCNIVPIKGTRTVQVAVLTEKDEYVKWVYDWRGFQTITIEKADKYKLGFYLYKKDTSAEGDTYEFRDCQFEPGNVATSYEPYCGGIPAPNPNYPIEPKFLENVSVVSRGKNLFNKDLYVGAGYQSTSTLIDNGFRVTKTARASSASCSRAFSQVKMGDKIYLNCKITSSLANATPAIALFIDGEYNSWFYRNGRWESPTATVRFDGVARIVFYPNITTTDAGDYTDFTNVIATMTPPDPTPYEPYYDGGTAVLPVLRGLPDETKDEYNATTGVLKRNINTISYTGTEYWVKSSAKNRVATSHGVQNWIYYTGICTHFFNRDPSVRNSFAKTDLLYVHWPDGDVASFKAFLAEENAKGTPVTFWYAMKNPAAETYDPATLRQHPGYTQIIQQGGYAPAEIKATVYVKE